MFSGLRNFLYRHRKKFLFGGVLAGGMVLASKYAEYKYIQWQEKETHFLLEKQKRRQHFESTKRTANTTVLTLSSSVKELIVKELDSDSVLQAIRDQPETKHIAWQQLKIVAFSRAVSVSYASALLSSAVHVQLMLLGGYIYGDLIDDPERMPISQQIQRRYLLIIQYFIENGLGELINSIEKAVACSINGLSLARPLTLKQLEGIFQEIVLCLSGEHSQEATNSPYVLLPWSQYLIKETPCINEIPPKDGPTENLLRNMITETSDVLDSNDFNNVVRCLVQQGLNHILDRVAECYPADCSNNNGLAFIDEMNTKVEPAVESTYGNGPCSLPEVNPLLLHAELPVAKLIPILCHLVHGSLSPTPGQLMQKLLLDNKLESLGCNVYEGFSVPLLKQI